MDVAHGVMVEKQLDALIQRRARKGDLDPDEREDLWKASVRACNTRRREEMRAAWCEHRQGQAARLRTALEALITDHEAQAERYRKPTGRISMSEGNETTLGTRGLPYGTKAAEEMLRDRIKKLERRGYPDALAEPPDADA